MGLFTGYYADHLRMLVDKAKRLDLKLKDVQLLNSVKKIEEEIKEIRKEDFDALDLIVDLYHHGKIDKGVGQKIIHHAKCLLAELRKVEKKTRSGNLSSSDLRYLDSMLYGLEEFLKMEELYLNKAPGVGHGGHLRLLEIILKKSLVFNKVKIDMQGNKIFLDGIGIRNITIFGDKVRIIAEHYSSRSALEKIIKTGQLVSGESDPYAYAIVESHKLAMQIKKEENKEEKAHIIQKVLGIKESKAEGWIKTVIVAPVSRVWLRVRKGQPTHVAIESRVLPIKSVKPKNNLTRGFEVFYFQ